MQNVRDAFRSLKEKLAKNKRYLGLAAGITVGGFTAMLGFPAAASAAPQQPNPPIIQKAPAPDNHDQKLQNDYKLAGVYETHDGLKALFINNRDRMFFITEANDQKQENRHDRIRSEESFKDKMDSLMRDHYSQQARQFNNGQRFVDPDTGREFIIPPRVTQPQQPQTPPGNKPPVGQYPQPGPGGSGR